MDITDALNDNNQIDSPVSDSQTTDPLILALNDSASSSSYFERKVDGQTVSKVSLPTSSPKQSIQQKETPALLKPSPATAPVIQLSNLTSPQSTSVLDNLGVRFADLNKESDLNKRVQGIIDLQTQASSEINKIRQSTIDQTMAEYGIPQLEQMLKAGMARDRADPMWKRFLSDSTPTAMVRQQLETAKQRAMIDAKYKVDSNALIGGLSSKVDMYTKLALNDVQKDMNRDETRQLKADEFVGGLKADSLTTLSDIAGTPIDKATGLPIQETEAQRNTRLHSFYVMNQKDPIVKMITSSDFTRDQAIDGLLLFNSPALGRIAAIDQKAATGQDESVIKNQIQTMHAIANNTNGELDKKIQLMGLPASDINVKAIRTISDPTKDKKVITFEKKQAAAEIAKAFASWDNKNILFKGSYDLVKGLGDDTEANTLYQNMKNNNNGNMPTVSEFAKLYVNGKDNNVPEKEKAMRLDKLVYSFSGLIDNINKGNYGNVDKQVLLNQLKVSAVNTNSFGQNLINNWSAGNITAY